jgi:hypothetical protein
MKTSRTKVMEMGVIRFIQDVRQLPERRGKGYEERRRKMCRGGGEGSNVGVKPVSLEERLKEVEVFIKVRLKNRVREKRSSGER